MREKEYRKAVKDRCFKRTVYVTEHGVEYTPCCSYYDTKKKKCTLNCCVRKGQ